VRGMKIGEVLLILLAFPFINLALKLLSIPTIGTILGNIFASNDYLPLSVAVAVAIILTGWVIGMLVVWRVKSQPLYHALAIAIVACIYKAYRPDLNPVSNSTLSVFLLLTFFLIMVGTYVAQNRAA